MSHVHCHQPPEWNIGYQALKFKDGTWARGLTKTLEAVLSPDFCVSVALSQRPAKQGQKNGRKLGTKVDQMLTQWTTTGKKPRQSKAQPMFDAVVEALAERSWLPLKAQVPVGCHDMRLATRIDLVCQTLSGEIVIVELKCGFADYWDDHQQGFIKYPYQNEHISCRNKAFLQLLLTTHMYLHAQPSPVAFAGSYVLHIFRSSADNSSVKFAWHPLPYWMFCDRERLDQVVEVLKLTRDQNMEARKRIARNGRKRAKYRHTHPSPASGVESTVMLTPNKDVRQ
jgi:hypothetical protein